MFGDAPVAPEPAPAGGSPEPEPSAAGPTPAGPAPGTETDAADPAAPAGAASADAPSEGTPPDAAVPPVEADDPWKDSTAATYYVAGKPVTSEDIRVFGEGGAVIRPESLPNVLAKLAERDTLSERARTRDAEYQTLAKATEWTDQSSGKTFTGPDAAIELRIGNAALFAENQLLVEHLTDSDKLQSLLAIEQVPDGKGGLRDRVVLNPDALERLQLRAQVRSRELRDHIRSHFGSVLTRAATPPPDTAVEAPRLVQAVAVDAKLDAAVLTPNDRALLAEQLPYHITNGRVSVAWQKLATHLMQDRAQAKTAMQSVSSVATKAAKDGQARMLQAARGVRPVAQPPKQVTRAPTPQQEREATDGALFDMMESAQARALRTAAGAPR